MPTVNTLVAWWLAEKQPALAPNSLRQYRLQLAPLCELHGDLDVQELTRDKLRSYLIHRGHWSPGQPKTGSTRRIAIAVLQQWLKWLVEFDHLPASPLKDSDLRKPAIAQRKEIPTPEQLKRLLSVSQQRPDWQRLYLALRMTGCRPSELCQAQIVDLEQGSAGLQLRLRKHKTVAKTGERIIPLSEPVVEVIQSAVGNRRSGPVFVTEKGRPWDVEWASRLFRRFAREAQLPEALVLYSARHEFGTKVTELGGIAEAKELLGHTNITTTQRYAHPTLSHLSGVQGRAAAALTPE